MSVFSTPEDEFLPDGLGAALKSVTDMFARCEAAGLAGDLVNSAVMVAPLPRLVSAHGEERVADTLTRLAEEVARLRPVTPVLQ